MGMLSGSLATASIAHPPGAPRRQLMEREREREREEMSLDPPIMSIGDKLNIDPDKQ